MPPIRLKLLGGFEARLPDGRLVKFGTRKSEALLAFLAYRPGAAHSRDRLAGMFWGDDGDAAARHSLRQALAALRRALGPEAALLRAGRDAVSLDAAAVDADIVAFELLRGGSDAQALETAARLYRGSLLDGFILAEEPFERWLGQERARLHDLAIALLLKLSAIDGAGEIATAALVRAVELDPSCEEAHRGLMRVHIASADYNAAIRQYHSCVEALRRELEVSPEPQTTALHVEAIAARARAVSPLPRAHVAEAAPTGELKQVTVLCMTLTSTLDARDAEQTQNTLEPIVREMRAIAVSNGGSIISEASDELIAIFGAPVARENDAANACRAAADMVAAGDKNAATGFRPTIGIDSGEVVVRTRDQSLLPAGVFGQCLRTAARLARSGFVPIGATQATVALANRFWRFAPIDGTSPDPQIPARTLYAPVGPWPGASGLDHFPAHLLSRFIGRHDELAAMTAALAPAAAGQGQLIAVVGEPGIGKSRLFHEFVRSVPESWRVVVARGDPQLSDVPYLPIAKAVRSCLGIGAHEGTDHWGDELIRVLRALDPLLEPWLPALSSLLDVDIDEPAWLALEPAQKRRQIIAAATLVFRHSADRQPLVLVVEDLHWLDPASRSVLERLVESVPTARMLLMVNYRPDFVHDWGRRSFYRHISMGPLSAATTAEFVDALLGNDVSVESLRARLVASTGGNPFFTEECIRSLIHNGALAGKRGAYQAQRELGSLVLPETVQAVIAARIDQLSAADRMLLRVAAVIGNDVPSGLLSAVADLDEETLRVALSRLQASEFLIEMSLASNATYRFKHALTNEVAYNTLLQQARRDLHARILSALEEQHAGRLDDHIEALAYHSTRGHVYEKAFDYNRRAGCKAMARAAYRVAVVRFDEALASLLNVPETQERIAQEIDLRMEMRNALFVLGEHGRVIEHLRRAEALAERTNDLLRRAIVALQIGGWFWYDGQLEASLAAGQRVRAIAREIDNAELKALAWYRIGQSHHAAGDYRPAIDALLRSTTMLEASGAIDLEGFGGYPYAFCCSFLAWCHAELGEFAQAREWGSRGWRFTAERNHTYTQSVMSFGFGMSLVLEGCLAEAQPILERGIELYEIGELAATFSWVASPLGYTYVVLGQPERGFELLHRALEVEQPDLNRARLELWFADASLLCGLPDQSREAALRGFSLAKKHGEKAQLVWAERILGDIVSTRDPAAAQAHYERAMAMGQPLELRAELAAARRGLSLLLAEGRSAEAHGR